VTDHSVPAGNPLSEKTTDWGMGVQTIVTDHGAPSTVAGPLDGMAAQSATAPMRKGYVPFVSVNESVAALPDCVLPLSVTDHIVPEGRPTSVKFTGYAEIPVYKKTIEMGVGGAPATTTIPLTGVGPQPDTAPTWNG